MIGSTANVAWISQWSLSGVMQSSRTARHRPERAISCRSLLVRNRWAMAPQINPALTLGHNPNVDSRSQFALAFEIEPQVKSAVAFH